MDDLQHGHVVLLYPPAELPLAERRDVLQERLPRLLGQRDVAREGAKELGARPVGVARMVVKRSSKLGNAAIV